ncbi:uncharacterized protein LOC115881074 [Sitophilus oryzae]|uniref:Uncharacterized protein LOC115881074 n=1 Tax=Sitophilus oryzae TaxID=7048 RepID=A0A6J2XS18_SITOR|nr:uncharacterized protein LOC115881074 [Sitophilus oryzae]
MCDQDEEGPTDRPETCCLCPYDKEKLFKSLSENFTEVYRESLASVRNLVIQTNNPSCADEILNEVVYKTLSGLYLTDDPNTTMEIIKRKISNLRLALQNELDNVKKPKKPQESTGNVYTPELLHYDPLSFISDQKEQTYRSNEDSDCNLAQEDSCDVLSTSKLLSKQSSSSRLSQKADSTEVKTKTIQSLTEKNKNKQEESAKTEQLDCNEDLIITGKYIVNKLKGLSKDKLVLAEKLIMDVLFTAEMGTLSIHSRIVHGEPNVQDLKPSKKGKK